jgi:rRNA small subunit pseudouridine methyltransferase Nep1
MPINQTFKKSRLCKNMTLTIILADTALELIPTELQKHASVQNNLKKYGNPAKLFDTSLHHSLLETLPDSERRGRPDILHHFLLDTLGSIANLHGRLEIYFHISQGSPRLFRVNPAMRPPRDYLRFKALMAQLLEIGRIPEKGDPLISEINESLDILLKKEFTPKNIIKFSSRGESAEFGSILQELKTISTKTAVIIGGFQKGEFSPVVKRIPGRYIAMSDRPYDSWTIVQRVLALYEIHDGLLK